MTDPAGAADTAARPTSTQAQSASTTSDASAAQQPPVDRDHPVTYVGTRYIDRGIHEKCRVVRQPAGQELRPGPSRALQAYSRGFEWGYAGSGPTQLALAVLLDYFDDEELALACHQRFSVQVVADLECDHGESWELTGTDIEAAVAEIATALNLDIDVGGGAADAPADASPPTDDGTTEEGPTDE